MTITTKVLDRAAFLMCYGAKLQIMEGKYPEMTYTLEIEPELHQYERKHAMVQYRKFCNMRKKLKKLGKKQSGTPMSYGVGRITHWKLKDVANFVKWNDVRAVTS